jgi:hypothetical protein
MVRSSPARPREPAGTIRVVNRWHLERRRHEGRPAIVVLGFAILVTV